MWSRTVAAVMSVALAAGVGYAAPSAKTKAAEAASLVTQGNNAFALTLYQRLQDTPNNLFFSPFSISTVLAMTHAGAKGSTQKQLEQTLCFPTSAETLKKLGLTREPLTQEQFDKAFGRIIKDLNKQAGRNKNELRIANALWGQIDYEFAKPFLTIVKKQYGGAFGEVDYITGTEDAYVAINAWVQKATYGNIKNLVERDMLNSNTRLVLTDAIYFKGKWASPFARAQTQEEPFTVAGGGKVQVLMMNQRARFDYAQIDAVQLLDMPYAGDKLSMMILLPKDAGGIRRLEQDLTVEKIPEWLGQVSRQEVIVSLPRFRMVGKLDLAAELQAMGMTDAFSRDKADFTGMVTGVKGLYVSAVVHQALIDVNEEGTEAAAATGAVMGVTSAKPEPTPVFRADHPFVFLIRDKASGSILFLGRVMSPEA
ncbi:MAG: serpin family protein [Solirubrobacterales bacterium]